MSHICQNSKLFTIEEHKYMLPANTGETIEKSKSRYPDVHKPSQLKNSGLDSLDHLLGNKSSELDTKKRFSSKRQIFDGVGAISSNVMKAS